MSDSIVLWRMCVVWDRARSVRVFSAALLVATLGLNIANIVVLERITVNSRWFRVKNHRDSEIISTYGLTPIGLAAAFVSLASNFCATVLVGIKAWCVSTRDGTCALRSLNLCMLGSTGRKCHNSSLLTLDLDARW